LTPQPSLTKTSANSSNTSSVFPDIYSLVDIPNGQEAANKKRGVFNSPFIIKR